MQMTSRATRAVLALSLALASGALAGDNENATFSLVGDAEVSGVGGDERVSLEISAEGFVGVKQLQVVLEVSDAAHFDLSSARLALGAGFEEYQTLVAPSKAVEGSAVQAELGGAVVGGDQVDGSAGFTVSIKTSDGFTSDTEASVSVAMISVGPSLDNRDGFTAEALDLVVFVNADRTVAAELEEQVVPLSNALQQNYPNPFNPGTTIRFDLAEGAFVSLRIYDALGQVVRTLADTALPPGSHERVWDGRDARGRGVGSGVYFYELRSGTFSSMKKMILVR